MTERVTAAASRSSMAALISARGRRLSIMASRSRRPCRYSSRYWGAWMWKRLEPMIEPVNLLVLDEPTNHLDLPSCDVLEDALTAYPGTVLLVTHDRHLIRNVADAVIEVRDGRATWHRGVPEEVLTPPDPSKVARSKGLAPRPVDARAERRRDGARARQASADLRKRVRQLEKGLVDRLREYLRENVVDFEYYAPGDD